MLRSFTKRGTRLAWLVTKRSVGTFFQQGLEKLVLMPFLLHYLGKDQFGEFVLILGWTGLVMRFPATGVSDGLMRLYTISQKKGQWPDLLRAGIQVMLIATGTIGLLALAGVLLLRPEYLAGRLVPCILLSVVAGMDGLRCLLLVPLRLDLRFGIISFTEAAVGVVLLLGVPLVWIMGLPGVVLAYCLAYAMVFMINLKLSWPVIKGDSGHRREWISSVLTTSTVMALMALMSLATRQVARLTIGVFDSTGNVAVFYAAEATMAIFMVPMTYISSVIYTLISRKDEAAAIDRHARVQHMIGCLAGAGLFLVIAHIADSYVLQFFYPKVAEQALPLFHIMLWGGAVMLLQETTRGFLLKFCRLRRILAMVALNLVVMATLVITLTAWKGLTGAAWGVCLGGIFIGISWFATYVWMFIFHTNVPTPPSGTGTAMPPSADTDLP